MKNEQSYRLVDGRQQQRPPWRRLRGYAFDPILSTSVATAMVNQVVFRVAWEDGPETGNPRSVPDQHQTVNGPAPSGLLTRGPIGEYLEVIDYDPASGVFYEPVDLNAPLLLAQDGLQPAEGNPQFHQQMVYAVAMTTIEHFERALGRLALWAPVALDNNGQPVDGPVETDQLRFVQRLRVYPHGLRNANAFYSPTKNALLFGYFPAPERTATTTSDGHFPGGWVFTCLSHDIIAHETTHALLHGMFPRYTNSYHPDTLAFHEAFADLVALFQHFTFPDVLRNQIARTRGDLSSQNLLGELAQQFGQATGQHGALRSAIGKWTKSSNGTTTWEPREPDPDELGRTLDPHGRGAILVAAVFDAFIAVYSARIADLVRIASSGTGILPAGELHPDLVNRLAAEAANTAEQVLRICIRALDYCPPVDLTFGDYLRAIITADSDLVPTDDSNFRIAFIEAFRRRGIYPENVRTMSVDSLRWPLRQSMDDQGQIEDISTTLEQILGPLRNHNSTRAQYFDRVKEARSTLPAELYDSISQPIQNALRGALLLHPSTYLPDLKQSPDGHHFSVEDVRLADRIGPDGVTRVHHAVVVITQTRQVDIGPDDNDPQIDLDPILHGRRFEFVGGATLIFDLDTYELRYAITKSVYDDARLQRQLQLERRGGADFGVRSAYRQQPFPDEPFALLHQETLDDLPGGMQLNA